MRQKTSITACRQCGSCCRNGGPALRRDDLALVRQGFIRHDQLVAIREGELGFNPASGTVEPVPVELLKIRGKAGGWACLFFEEATSRCAIYQQRPSTCAILECWRPEALLATIYQDTLSRRDLLNPEDPILEYIERHERQCPGRQWSGLLARFGEKREAAVLVQLAELVRADLAIREEVVARTGISPEMELFVLGRPFVTQLAGSGLAWDGAAGRLRPA
ncbi:MAG: YkgJ family cysteine cluster protein [Thermodesulfobacteriota bacterium]